MIDITRQVRAFANGRLGWTSAHSLEIARAVAWVINAKISWDPRAGEEWIKIVDGAQGLGIISTTGPLAVVVCDIAKAATEISSELEFIVVPDLHDSILTADQAPLIQAFGERMVTSPAFCSNRFSAEELWFASL